MVWEPIAACYDPDRPADGPGRLRLHRMDLEVPALACTMLASRTMDTTRRVPTPMARTHIQHHQRVRLAVPQPVVGKDQD